MGSVRCQVTGPAEIGGVARPGVVHLDPELVNVRALERAGHVRRVEPEPEPEPQEGPFVPGEHTVDEVNAYLELVSAEEVERVVALERDGKARKTILSAYEQPEPEEE